MNFRLPFRALAHRNFQLFFAGQGISLIGTWMQQVAMAWLVYDLSDSPFMLGLVGFSSQIPAFFLAPVAGVLVDHWDRKRLILGTQTVAMLQAFALAALTLFGVVTVPEVIVLSIVLGLVNAFDMPARQAFLTELVGGREDLANAIALNSALFNGARLIGPALAGVLLEAAGADVCFLVNGISYLAVLAALWAMRVQPRKQRPAKARLVHGMREGFRYAFGFAPIRALLLLLALVSLAGMSYAVLLPLIAKQILHGGAGTFALLTTASGIGALVGAVALAARTSVVGLGWWIMTAPGVFGLVLVAFSFTESLLPAMVLLAVGGFLLMFYMGASNTVLQTIVEEDKRGRVMSLYTMAFMGMSPLGSLLAGYLADRIGAPYTLRVAGLACVAGSFAFALQFRRLRALVRPIYIRMGILPEMPSSVHPALSPPDPEEVEE